MRNATGALQERYNVCTGAPRVRGGHGSASVGTRDAAVTSSGRLYPGCRVPRSHGCGEGRRKKTLQAGGDTSAYRSSFDLVVGGRRLSLAQPHALAGPVVYRRRAPPGAPFLRSSGELMTLVYVAREEGVARIVMSTEIGAVSRGPSR